MGRADEESKEESVFNRMIRMTDQGWEYEADQRHSDIIIKAMEMEECKPVSIAGEEQKAWQVQEEKEELPESQ